MISKFTSPLLMACVMGWLLFKMLLNPFFEPFPSFPAFFEFELFPFSSTLSSSSSHILRRLRLRFMVVFRKLYLYQYANGMAKAMIISVKVTRWKFQITSWLNMVECIPMGSTPYVTEYQ